MTPRQSALETNMARTDIDVGISRRHFNLGLFASLALAPAAMSVGGTGRAAAQEPRVLRWATWRDWGGAIPIHQLQRPSSSPEEYSIGLFNGLVWLDPSNGYAPTSDLAESWTVSDDGLTYTFTLRPNLKFHDGSPVTADDVVFTIETIRDPKHNSPVQGDLAPVAGVEALDEATVRIVLAQFYAPFLSNLAFGIAPKHLLEPELASGKAVNETDFARAPIGTGPFKLVSLRAGQEMIVEANPDYHRDVPAIDRIVFLLRQDPEALFLRFQAGEIDGAGISPVYAEPLRAAGIVVEPMKGTFNNAILFNTKLAPFDDKRVRLALNRYLDKEALLALVNGGLGAIGGSPYPNSIWDATDLARLNYDPAAGDALLTEAGFAKNASGIWERDGVALAIPVNDAFGYTDLVETVASQWQQAGIDATAVPVDEGTLWGNLATIPAMTYTIGAATDPDAMYFIFHSTMTFDRGGYNAGSYANPAVDAALEAGRLATSLEARKAAYAELQAALVDDPPYAWALVDPALVAFSPAVNGYTPDITVAGGAEIFWNINRWTLEKAT